MQAIISGEIAKLAGENMIKFPEAALGCGTALVITSHNSLGMILIAISLMTAFFKWSMELHLLRQSQEAKGALMANLSEVVSEFLTSKGITYASGRNDDGTLH